MTKDSGVCFEVFGRGTRGYTAQLSKINSTKIEIEIRWHVNAPNDHATGPSNALSMQCNPRDTSCGMWEWTEPPGFDELRLNSVDPRLLAIKMQGSLARNTRKCRCGTYVCRLGRCFCSILALLMQPVRHQSRCSDAGDSVSPTSRLLSRERGGWPWAGRSRS